MKKSPLKTRVLALVGNVGGHKQKDCKFCQNLAIAAAMEVLDYIIESGNTGETIEELRKSLRAKGRIA